MKKISAWILILVFGMNTYAQTNVYLGPSFGLGINKIKTLAINNNFELGEFLYGPNIGASLELRFNDYFALNSGVFYGRRGQSYGDNKLVIHQLEYPVLAKVGYGSKQKWQIYGIGGFKMGNGIRAKYVEKNSSNFDREYILEYGSEGDLQRFYFAASYGAGVSLKLASGKLVFDFTQDIALTTLNKDEVLLNGGIIQKQRNLNFALSYVLLLSGD